MKFVAVALALLLAVGSHAASLQADEAPQAPEWLNDLGSFLDKILPQAQSTLKTAYAQLEPQHQAIKDQLETGTDQVFTLISGARAAGKPVLAGVINTVKEFLTSLGVASENSNVGSDILNLTTTLLKHLNQYQETLFDDNFMNQVKAMKATMDASVTSLEGPFKTNLEETRAAAKPIVDRFGEIIGKLKVAIQPYYDEYMDQPTGPMKKLTSLTDEQKTTLYNKLEVAGKNLRTSMDKAAEEVYGAFTAVM